MYETYMYHPQNGLKMNLSREEIKTAVTDEKNFIWIDMVDLDDDDIDILSEIFNLHSLTIEDFIMANARPKIENFKDYFFLIMFSMESHDKEKRKINTSELDCCLGKNFLVTAHNNNISPLNIIKDRIKKQSPIIRNNGDFLLYSILDCLVDGYFPVINEFDDMVDEMSDELFSDPSNETLKRIYTLKNEIMYLRRTIGPQADVINLITRSEFPFVSQANGIYFRNVYDNLVRLNDIVGTSRDVVTGAMEAYVSVVSNRLNEIMKTLTVITTLIMPPTLIASIYGMNFKHMPELTSKFGYPLAIGSMLLCSVILLYYFRRKKWF